MFDVIVVERDTNTDQKGGINGAVRPKLPMFDSPMMCRWLS